MLGLVMVSRPREDEFHEHPPHEKSCTNVARSEQVFSEAGREPFIWGQKKRKQRSVAVRCASVWAIQDGARHVQGKFQCEEELTNAVRTLRVLEASQEVHPPRLEMSARAQNVSRH